MNVAPDPEPAPCPFCGMAVQLQRLPSGLVNFLCQEGSTCRGSGLIICCHDNQLEAALTAWNHRNLT